MGIIQRQSIKRSIVQYLGALIGLLATIFVYARYNELYGLAQFIIDGAILLSYFVLLGANTLPVRFFPFYADSKPKRNAFFSYLLFSAIVGTVVFVLIFYSIKDLIQPWLSNDNDPLFNQFIFWSFPLGIIIAYKALITSQISNYKRIVVPSLLDGFFLKLALPTLILLTVYIQWSYEKYVVFLIGLYALIGIVLVIYLHSLDRIRIVDFRKFMTKKSYKEMVTYGVYGLFGALGTFLALRIDTLFVARYVDTASTGVYKTMSYFTTLLEIPYLSILAITGPIVANRLKENNIKEISSLYQTSSQLLFAFGSIFFLGIVLNAEDLFRILPFTAESNVSMAFFVIGCIGVARLFDLATSINTQIIVYSDYYRFNLYTILLLGVLNIGLDYYLVPTMGLKGAALATMISILLYNLIKIVFIYVKFDIWPFSRNMLYILFISLGAFIVIVLLPIHFGPWINIALKSGLLLLIHLGPLYLLGYLDPFFKGLKNILTKST